MSGGDKRAMLRAKKPKERPKQKDVWALAISICAVTISLCAFLLSGAVGYYSALRWHEELSVVVTDFQPVLFRPDKDEVEIRSSVPFSIIFINSGTRPITLLRISLYLTEATESNIQEERAVSACSPGRVFQGVLDPFVIKEKEILRKQVSGLKFDEYYSGKDVRIEHDKMAFPFPSWYSRVRGYSVDQCLTFSLVSPSEAYGRVGLELHSVTSKGDYDYYGGQLSSSRPHVIHKNSGTVIFD